MVTIDCVCESMRSILVTLEEAAVQVVKMEADRPLEFSEAQALAVERAAESLNDPMVLGWLNRATGRHSPDVDCCQEEGKETWEIYAESRGGTLRIEVGEQYVFILRKGLAA